MITPLTILFGKAVIRASRLAGHSGTALAGKWMEKLSPSLIQKLSKQFDEGVVAVTGTNGKTTTTKMIVELLEKQGLRVFTNRSGSNFTRGVLSAMADKASIFGQLDYDIAVLELDEAFLKQFAQKVPLRTTLVLNLFRDQLDRYGEVSTTADHIAKGLKYSKHAVLNADDPEVVSLKDALKDPDNVTYFGVSAALRKQLPNDNELHGHTQEQSRRLPRLVNLEKFTTTKGRAVAGFKIDGTKHNTELSLRGAYNALNATAALSVVKSVLPDSDHRQLVDSLQGIQPAFGRGEVFEVDGTSLVLGLVKNPAGFNQNLNTLVTDSTKNILISINDNFADGRDVSWLWDVNVDNLKEFNGKIFVTGSRAYDMALRLKYADIKIADIETDIAKSFRKARSSKKELVVLPTYTSMLILRKEIGKLTEAREIH